MENKNASIDISLDKQLKNPITAEIVTIGEVRAVVKEIYVKKMELTSVVADEFLDKYLNTFLAELRDDLTVVVESPYVDKIYRDTYYHYYSSKLNRYYRDCIRLSFFLPDMDLYAVMANELSLKDMRSAFDVNYLGFLILRPTFPKIIGRNSISPKAKKESSFLCCLAKVSSSVLSIKQKIASFPHASQDTQTMTCAETTVWSLFEYFGNKYPEYKPVLLTHITKTMHRFSYKRLLPSDGLTAEQITYAIREFGFGAMIHSKAQRENSEFDMFYILRTYVESGIPVVAVLKNKIIGHAFNIVGREFENRQAVVDTEPHYKFRETPVVDFNQIDRRYVVIDDNYPPYQLTNLDMPCKVYYKDEKWHDCEITNIIIPLHSKVYLDAAKACKNFQNILENERFGLNGTDKKIMKIFLASTRSYKQYVALNGQLNILVKKMIAELSMPKFIWVAEISKTESYLNGQCDGLYILDATEPYSDSSIFSNMSLLAGYIDGTFFVQNFGNFNGINTFANSFDSYKDNLS